MPFLGTARSLCDSGMLFLLIFFHSFFQFWKKIVPEGQKDFRESEKHVCSRQFIFWCFKKVHLSSAQLSWTDLGSRELSRANWTGPHSIQSNSSRAASQLAKFLSRCYFPRQGGGFLIILVLLVFTLADWCNNSQYQGNGPWYCWFLHWYFMLKLNLEPLKY